MVSDGGHGTKDRTGQRLYRRGHLCGDAPERSAGGGDVRAKIEVPKQYGALIAQRLKYDDWLSFQAVEDKQSGTGIIQEGAARGTPFKKLKAEADKVCRAGVVSIYYENRKVFHPPPRHLVSGFRGGAVELSPRRLRRSGGRVGLCRRTARAAIAEAPQTDGASRCVKFPTPRHVPPKVSTLSSHTLPDLRRSRGIRRIDVHPGRSPWSTTSSPSSTCPSRSRPRRACRARDRSSAAGSAGRSRRAAG